MTHNGNSRGPHQRFGAHRSEPTREIGMGIAATLLTIASIAGGVLAFHAGGWWLLLLIQLVPLAAVGTYGACESFASIERDQDGNRRTR